MKQDSAFRVVATLLFTLLLAATASANGEEFFAPAKNGKIDLVYYGRIKDSRTGRSVTDSVYFVLTDKATGLSFPFTNDKPGHFRSPDVGAAIKDIGEQVNPTAFAIDVNAAGYKRATITRMPRKPEGTLEIDVRLEPVGSGDVGAAGLGVADGTYPTAAILAIGSLLLLVIVKAVRTSIRRRTTAR